MNGAVARPLTTWLRLEGAAVAALAVFLYAAADHSWLLFALLILAPDLSFAGYLFGPPAGAVAYNVLHSYIAPATLAIVLLLLGAPTAIPLIWAAHIGVDRLAGYGLKYPTAFHDTHLGRIGRLQ